MSRSSACARRSNAIPPTRSSSRRFAAPATKRSADRDLRCSGTMIRGVRARLTATIVALVVVTAGALGFASWLFVETGLRQQALDDARDQARFDLSVLAPSRLGDPPSDAAIEALARDFSFRDLPTIIVPADREPYLA